MTRRDYLAWTTSALLVVGFADWLARQHESQAGALNASATLTASSNRFSSALRESPSDVAAGVAETEGVNPWANLRSSLFTKQISASTGKATNAHRPQEKRQSSQGKDCRTVTEYRRSKPSYWRWGFRGRSNVNNDLNASLARTKLFKQKLEAVLDQRFGNKGAKSMNTPTNSTNDDALDVIDAPFTLDADAIVERVDKDTGATVYEVEEEGKVIYSTITRPLAFAFLAGVNANPAKSLKGKPPKDEGGKPATASVQPSSAAASDPSAGSGQAQDRLSSATPPASTRKRAVLWRLAFPLERNGGAVNPHLIAYSEEHDGICDLKRSVTFHEAANEANPAFAHYRLAWEDALGCRHFVRYDLELQMEAPPSPSRPLIAWATTKRRCRRLSRPLKNSFPPQFDSVPDSLGFRCVHDLHLARSTFSTPC
jgi:hypothetical protein